MRFYYDQFFVFQSHSIRLVDLVGNNQIWYRISNIIVSKSEFITSGILSSPDSNGGIYYLKNQTSSEYPSYVLHRGQARSGDVPLFRTSHDVRNYERFTVPNITIDEIPQSDNR
jgi:hypothetical protein